MSKNTIWTLNMARKTVFPKSDLPQSNSFSPKSLRGACVTSLQCQTLHYSWWLLWCNGTGWKEEVLGQIFRSLFSKVSPSGFSNQAAPVCRSCTFSPKKNHLKMLKKSKKERFIFKFEAIFLTVYFLNSRFFEIWRMQIWKYFIIHKLIHKKSL